MFVLSTFFYGILGGTCLLGILFLIFEWIYANTRYRGNVSDHFDGRHFYNIGWSTQESYTIEKSDTGKGGIIYWLFHKKKVKWKKRPITYAKVEKRVRNGIRITNIGHSTYLIQVGGYNILTDPMWSERASPFSWIGPKRYTEAGIRFEDLPDIDVILLSHNHYDHMDIPTLRKLALEKGNPKIYTGLGNGAYLKKRGIDTAIEMDWWEYTIFPFRKEKSGENDIDNPASKLGIYFLPAQHFSARSLRDRNRTLWGGFRLEIGDISLYFAGDTGYGPFAQKIREKFPQGFNYGLIPIGAYKPRWFMAPVHTDPFEGMQIQKDLQIEKAIGIHHSTFDLADDNQDDPIEDLAQAKKMPEYQNQIFEIGSNGTVWNW